MLRKCEETAPNEGPDISFTISASCYTQPTSITLILSELNFSQLVLIQAPILAKYGSAERLPWLSPMNNRCRAECHQHTNDNAAQISSVSPVVASNTNQKGRVTEWNIGSTSYERTLGAEEQSLSTRPCGSSQEEGMEQLKHHFIYLCQCPQLCQQNLMVNGQKSRW